MFIFIGVKIIKVKETASSRLIQSFQTVQNSQVKGTLTRRGIVKRRNFIQHWVPLDNGWWRRGVFSRWHNDIHGIWILCLKSQKCFLGCSILIEHLPCANEKHGVGAFRWSLVGAKANDMIRKVLALQLLVEFVTKSIELSQVEWTKVQKEVPVDQLRVDTEEMYRLVFNFSIRACCCQCMIRTWLCFERGAV